MSQSDFIKATDEWKALNQIWKSCSSTQQVQLCKEFELLTKFIRSHTPISAEPRGKDGYAYLSRLSPEARQFVISIAERGEKNIYHSVMAIIDNKPQFSQQELKDYYLQKYGEKRPYLLENESYVSEVIELCWNRSHGNRK